MPTIPSKTKKSPTPPPPKQRALVVGVSTYAPPLNNLPAVSADVREIAKTLSSRHGIYRSTGVMVLTEKQATKQEVLKALRKVFWGAKADETIFVYLAGHGDVEKRAYYFLAQDTDPYNLTVTGVPLSEIKRFFDSTACRRVFLWLDCCRSGGIIARNRTVAKDLASIRREIGVVQGEGKIIIAACTESQSAYEDNKIGHGLFTHALLRGLKGEAKDSSGEVTASSLYDFIDREVKDPRQQPVFSGKMAGRIVLMHYPSTASSKAKVAVPPSKPTRTPAKTAPATTGRVMTSGKYVLLDGRVYLTRVADENHDGSWELQILARTPEEGAALRALRADRYSHNRSVSFAYLNQGFRAEVEEVTARTTDTSTVWTVSLKPSSDSRGYLTEMGYNSLSVEQLAEYRARLILLGEKPVAREGRNDDYLTSFVLGELKELGVNGAVLPLLWKSWKGTPTEFLRLARLWLVYYLHVDRVCDDLFELTLRRGKDGFAVRFRGQRTSQYRSEDPKVIEITGVCPL